MNVIITVNDSYGGNVLETVLHFASANWAAYGDTILTCLFWAGIGCAVTLPVSLMGAVYNSVRIGSMYDAHGEYTLGKRRYRRDVKFYGAANLVLVLAVLILIV